MFRPYHFQQQNEIPEKPEEPYFRIMAARRIDWLQAKLVQEGIALQSNYGTDSAARFLRAKKIDLDLALRVLAHPRARRHHDLQ